MEQTIFHFKSDPSGIRTRATRMKALRPRPLNDGAKLQLPDVLTGLEPATQTLSCSFPYKTALTPDANHIL